MNPIILRKCDVCSPFNIKQYMIQAIIVKFCYVNKKKIKYVIFSPPFHYCYQEGVECVKEEGVAV